MVVKFSKTQCYFLSWTFGSYDWSPGDHTGDMHCRLIVSFLEAGTLRNGNRWTSDEHGMMWTVTTARLFYNLALATCSAEELYRGEVETMHRPYPPKRTRDAIMRKVHEVMALTGVSVIDLLADLTEAA